MFDGQTLSKVGVTSANVRYPKPKQAQNFDFCDIIASIKACLLFDLMEIRIDNICSINKQSETGTLMAEFAV